MADKWVTKFEHDARNWKKKTVFVMSMCLITALLGAYALIDSYEFTNESKEQILKHYIDDSAIPSPGIERDYWMLGSFRKCAVILEYRFKFYQLLMFESVLGTGMFAAGGLAFVVMLMRLNKGPEKMVIAKLLRNNLEQLRETENNSNLRPPS